jgi:hypothetical protein
MVLKTPLGYSRHIHRHARGISFGFVSSVPAQLDRLYGQLAYATVMHATENNPGLEMFTCVQHGL